MAHVDVVVPDAALSSLRYRPEELGREVQLAVAIQWYQQGRISQEWAAEIAGLDRTDFLLALARLERDSFLVDFEDLNRELARG